MVEDYETKSAWSLSSLSLLRNSREVAATIPGTRENYSACVGRVRSINYERAQQDARRRSAPKRYSVLLITDGQESALQRCVLYPMGNGESSKSFKR